MSLGNLNLFDLNNKYIGSTAMQCPPTKPGLNLIKFHFVDAAFKTSFELIDNLSQRTDISFIRAILTNLCVFSKTFESSAILILDTG